MFHASCFMTMNNIFQKFSTHSKQALKNAFGLALSLGQKSVQPQHILYGLTKQKGSISAEILIRHRINSLKLKSIISKTNSSSQKINQLDLTTASKKILEKAVLIASINKHPYVGTEHLLAATLEINDEEINNFFTQNNIDFFSIKKQLEIAIGSVGKFSDLTGALEKFNDKNDEMFLKTQGSISQPAALDFFATNLTDTKIQKDIDPVVGRENEIDRLVQILSRRNKNNPILLGDPGVGKTAIVEGLAKKILLGQVPEFLADKKIYTLDLGAVVAGTSFRGEFENRVKQIISEIKKDPNIILFIDELHNIIGAGSATGSMDAANILKPALARGQIRCIGATTLEEYKKNIESDPALERRFQSIFVNQSSIDETIEILQGIKINYEIFHQVKITDDAITAAAKLSERYLPDRFLPDKAIDLIDEAAAAAKIKQSSDKQLIQIKELEKQLEKTRQTKEEKVKNEEFASALDYKTKEQEIIDQLNSLRQTRATKNQKEDLVKITKQDIVKIIAKITNIPLADLILEEKAHLLNLEKTLAKKIIGQPQALQIVAESIRRSRTGIADSNRPIGSFIFLGPSGVGKTELAKVLAQSVFGSDSALVRIDMSEFAESFNVSKLIGAPAGYVGYKEGAKLTDMVKRRPYSVVLFDEIEKAHPQIFNLLLQILEDGFLTDATGKKINFKNTIIIMTSNIGSEKFNQQAALGFEAKSDKEKQIAQTNFEQIQNQVLKKLKQNFLPEFLNRIDKTIVFKPLEITDIAKIANLQFKKLKNRIAEQNIKIEIEPQVARAISKISYSPDVGARLVRKNIQEIIEGQIANKILTKNRRKISVKVQKNKITI